MKGKNRHRRKKKRGKLLLIAAAVIGTVTIGTAIYIIGFSRWGIASSSPEELLVQYMNHIPKKEYEQMYAMLNIEITAFNEEKKTVAYQTSFDTVAGNISFENEALFRKGEEGYKLVWNDSLIFPNLSATDKLRISTIQADRGEILDRNGRVLAGKGLASSVGLIPGKLENKEEAIQKIAELLDVEPEAIEKNLSAQWVKDDSFVPIKTIPKVEEIELMTVNPDEEVLAEKERQEKLLEISGVMISDTEVREYPLSEAAAHLVGYVQSVTAEDLEKHAGGRIYSELCNWKKRNGRLIRKRAERAERLQDLYCRFRR